MPSGHGQGRITWASDRRREIKAFDQACTGPRRFARTPGSTARCDESRPLTTTAHDGVGPDAVRQFTLAVDAVAVTARARFTPPSLRRSPRSGWCVLRRDLGIVWGGW